MNFVIDKGDAQKVVDLLTILESFDKALVGELNVLDDSGSPLSTGRIYKDEVYGWSLEVYAEGKSGS